VRCCPVRIGREHRDQVVDAAQRVTVERLDDVAGVHASVGPRVRGPWTASTKRSLLAAGLGRGGGLHAEVRVVPGGAALEGVEFGLGDARGRSRSPTPVAAVGAAAPVWRSGRRCR